MSAKKKNITIRDIGRIAKVSHTTVSRVINNDSRVSQETRKTVLNLIKKLDYYPDQRARSLVSKRTHVLGLIVADIRNQFYAELARGIEDKARERGYSVIFCSNDDDAQLMESYVNHLKHAGVDGLIIASARLNEPVVEKLILEETPLVLVNRKLKDDKANYVVLDNYKGAYLLTNHLIGIGYKKIAGIVGPLNLSTGLERTKGFQKAIKENDLEFREEFLVHGPFRRESGYTLAKKLLSLPDRPEAIFGGNDRIALGVFDAAEELGIKIPEQLGVIGFDDTEFASLKRISLTTVSQRKYEMGNMGVEILIDCIEREERAYKHKIVLEPSLIVRESCGHGLIKKFAKSQIL